MPKTLLALLCLLFIVNSINTDKDSSALTSQSCEDECNDSYEACADDCDGDDVSDEDFDACLADMCNDDDDDCYDFCDDSKFMLLRKT